MADAQKKALLKQFRDLTSAIDDAALHCQEIGQATRAMYFRLGGQQEQDRALASKEPNVEWVKYVMVHGHYTALRQMIAHLGRQVHSMQMTVRDQCGSVATSVVETFHRMRDAVSSFIEETVGGLQALWDRGLEWFKLRARTFWRFVHDNPIKVFCGFMTGAGLGTVLVANHMGLAVGGSIASAAATVGVSALFGGLVVAGAAALLAWLYSWASNKEVQAQIQNAQADLDKLTAKVQSLEVKIDDAAVDELNALKKQMLDDYANWCNMH